MKTVFVLFILALVALTGCAGTQVDLYQQGKEQLYHQMRVAGVTNVETITTMDQGGRFVTETILTIRRESLIPDAPPIDILGILGSMR
jgi:hypothetical protein